MNKSLNIISDTALEIAMVICTVLLVCDTFLYLVY